jgi:hypothetical protein
MGRISRLFGKNTHRRCRMASDSKQHNLCNGPDKHAFETCLFFGDNRNRVTVYFELGDKKKGQNQFQVIINSAQREDGSGQSWLFNGYVVSGRDMDGTLKLGPRYEAYYNFKNRQGWIRFFID